MGRVELVLGSSPLTGSREPSRPFQPSRAIGCSSAMRRPYTGSDGALCCDLGIVDDDHYKKLRVYYIRYCLLEVL